MQEVHEQKSAATFIAISEWVVLDHEIEQMSSLGFDGWVGEFTEGALVQIAKERSESVAAGLGEQLGRLASLHQLGLELFQSGHGLVGLGEVAARLAGWLLKQPLVVALEPEKGPGVVAEDFYKPLAGLGIQRGRGCSLADKMEGRFQFPGVFLKTMAVDGIAPGQVLFEDPVRPLAEPNTLLGFDPISHGDDNI